MHIHTTPSDIHSRYDHSNSEMPGRIQLIRASGDVSKSSSVSETPSIRRFCPDRVNKTDQDECQK